MYEERLNAISYYEVPVSRLGFASRAGSGFFVVNLGLRRKMSSKNAAVFLVLTFLFMSLAYCHVLR